MRRIFRLSPALIAAVTAIAILGGCKASGPAPAESAAPLPPALKIFDRIARQGNATAANQLGILYAAGVGVPQNFDQAKQWFDFASQHGDSDGEFNLGIAYLKGEGTPISATEAVHWFQIAADHGNPAAQVQLAIMHRNGEGGLTQDDNEAARLAKAAALQDYAPAQGLLAIYYRDGRGVEADDVLSYEWASLASARLTGEAGETTRQVRDLAAQHLSPAALAAAQRAAARWKKGDDLISPTPDASHLGPPTLRGHGSGFIVGKNGEIVSDEHVTSACREIKLRDSTGSRNVATHVIARDRANDVVVLAGGGFGTPLRIRIAPPVLGETVVTFGYPLTTLLAASGNLTTGTVSSATGFQGDNKTFQFSAPMQPGNSGGPVVDQSGAVVGISVSKLNTLAVAEATGDIAQNVNFATNASLIRTLMDKNGVAYTLSEPPRPRSNVELADRLQKSTVMIECWR